MVWDFLDLIWEFKEGLSSPVNTARNRNCLTAFSPVNRSTDTRRVLYTVGQRTLLQRLDNTMKTISFVYIIWADVSAVCIRQYQSASFMTSYSYSSTFVLTPIRGRDYPTLLHETDFIDILCYDAYHYPCKHETALTTDLTNNTADKSTIPDQACDGNC